MTVAPPLADAVTTLHEGWIRRVERWQQLAQHLPDLPPSDRRNTLQTIIADIEDKLLPYMRLEEAILEEAASPIVRLEHAAIRRGLERLRAVDSAATIQVHAAQAALAGTCNALLDHLRHESTVYLPRVEHPLDGTPLR